MKFTVKSITINAMGIALFVVLSMFLRVPVFENYYLCLGYIVMSVYCYSVGTISGTIVGTIGVILYCILINGLRGMPGWAAGNFVLGIIIGVAFKNIKKLKSSLLENIISSVIVIIGTAIAMLVIKSGIESLLYAQPFFIRVAKNIYAFISDAFMIIVSIPICKILDVRVKEIVNK